MERIPLMAGNWKMNMTTGEAVRLSQEISDKCHKAHEGVDIVLCPPFIDLKSVSNVLAFDKSKVMLGAQDVYWEMAGAFTGEISPVMLEEVGCEFCIIGHSERRALFGETDDTVNRKARALYEVGINPIICVGESLEVRDAGCAVDFVIKQVQAALEGLPADKIPSTVIAYEPIWAIGTGRTATPEAAEEVCAAIRATVASLYGGDAASLMRVLYGGSMKPENVALFMPMPDIDGGLIGGAALKASQFVELVEAFER